ncbi:unnamed protein product [Rhodiola kirilowii]
MQSTDQRRSPNIREQRRPTANHSQPSVSKNSWHIRDPPLCLESTSFQLRTQFATTPDQLADPPCSSLTGEMLAIKMDGKDRMKKRPEMFFLMRISIALSSRKHRNSHYMYYIFVHFIVFVEYTPIL